MEDQAHWHDLIFRERPLGSLRQIPAIRKGIGLQRRPDEMFEMNGPFRVHLDAVCSKQCAGGVMMGEPCGGARRARRHAAAATMAGGAAALRCPAAVRTAQLATAECAAGLAGDGDGLRRGGVARCAAAFRRSDALCHFHAEDGGAPPFSVVFALGLLLAVPPLVFASVAVS